MIKFLKCIHLFLKLAFCFGWLAIFYKTMISKTTLLPILIITLCTLLIGCLDVFLNILQEYFNGNEDME